MNRLYIATDSQQNTTTLTPDLKTDRRSILGFWKQFTGNTEPACIESRAIIEISTIKLEPYQINYINLSTERSALVGQKGLLHMLIEAR